MAFKYFLKDNAVIKKAMNAIGLKCPRKLTKLKPLAEPISMLGGSPIIVAVPPMLADRIDNIIKGEASISRVSEMRKNTGEKSSIVVTLSRKAEHIATVAHRNRIVLGKLPPPNFTVLIAMY